MIDLSPDEKIVLMIAHAGGPMAPIGRWKVPTESLAARGLLKPHPNPGDPTGYFNHYITSEGKAAAAKCDDEQNSLSGELIDGLQDFARMQRKCRAHAEQIAVQMIDLAELSAQATGDSKQDALKKWARIILERALEMLK